MLNVGSSTIVTPQVYALGILVSTEKKPYGPRKGNGEYMKQGDSVDIVMDTINGNLSFQMSGPVLGIVFNEISSTSLFLHAFVFVSSVTLLNSTPQK